MEFNLADLWERVVDTVPGHEALVCGERRFTFAEVDARANRLAHALSAAGIGPGDHVALYLYNSVEYLEGMLAALKLRAAPINVNYRYVEHELRYLLDDADARAVIYHAGFGPKLARIRAELPLLSTYVRVPLPGGEPEEDDAITDALDYDDLLDTHPDARDFPGRSADDLYILYTGGTTGMPKGVMWRQEDAFFGAMGGGGVGGTAIATPEEIAERCREGRTRCLPACPFMHGTAHWMAFGALFSGGTVVISPNHRFDPLNLWQLIAREQVNFLVIVGDAFARPLVDALDTDAGRALDVSSCHVLLSGGAILSPSVKQALIDRLPGTLVVDGYGASETGGQGQSVSVAGGEVSAAPRFSMNDETVVLRDDLTPAPPGEIGLLARRGHIPLGYYKDPVKTAATFPVLDGVRWSVPGDHAVLGDDGMITLLGRGSVSINTGGEKVYPEEVEAALKSHASVQDVIVVGVPDDRWGERVVAVVQARDGHEVALGALQEHAGTLIARYKVPRDVAVVDEIVRSPSGKPDYRWAKATAARELGNVAR
jgi:acyl-CoA synthetase (AMP-forming)/AMP-acid ligase II